MAIVIYLMSAVFLYFTAHMLLRAAGAPYLFEGSLQDYIYFCEFREHLHSNGSHVKNSSRLVHKIRKESLYSQFFIYWSTASEIIVYGPFEPFLQLAISCGCTVLVLNNIVSVILHNGYILGCNLHFLCS